MHTPQTTACLHVVGLGPGDASLITPMAYAALEHSSIIMGYSTYISLVPAALLQSRSVTATGMMAEMQRCTAAIEHVKNGAVVSLVCSGDPGVYAMAGLILELLAEQGLGLNTVPVNIVPGVPAVCAAAALLGAPLMHDFACVSLSDLLTPWEHIEKRVYHALAADFVLAVYNPRSHKRSWQLAKTLQLTREQRTGGTPIGHVRNAFRDDQSVTVSTLETFSEDTVDMFSLVIIGNSSSAILPGGPGGGSLDWGCGARMFTPRGYLNKYGKSDAGGKG